MKKVYLIAMFDKKTHSYIGTLSDVFETSDLAKDYLSFQYDNNTILFVVIAVPFYCMPK